MKRITLLALCGMVCLATQATELRFRIYYNEIEHIRGELYQYSERYLGTTDVEMVNDTTYEIEGIGQILPKSSNTAKPSSTSKEPEKERTIVRKQLPLSEETLITTNMAKKAESVAKQIYRIREARMNLLSGDVEHMPADGQSMELVLKELNKQEKALTSMFVGTTIIRPQKQIVRVHVEDSTASVVTELCRFSAEDGVLDANSESGEPLQLSITRKIRNVLAAEQPKKKNADPIYEKEIYQSVIRVTYNHKTLYEKTNNL
ncbi:MAG: DUF4831 family protein [Paludibacteraceae bacterium]|nr:DUF4831 family protein [Paludibacteraceae bacterium]